MRLTTRDPIDKHGKITPVCDVEYVGQPVVAYIITLEDGFYVSMNHTMVKRESWTEAMGYVERVRKAG